MAKVKSRKRKLATPQVIVELPEGTKLSKVKHRLTNKTKTVLFTVDKNTDVQVVSDAPPIPPVPVESPDGTRGPTVVDHSGAVFHMGTDVRADGDIELLRDAVRVGYGRGFLYWKGVVYAYVGSASASWFKWTDAGFVAIAGDPSIPPVVVVDPPIPPVIIIPPPDPNDKAAIILPPNTILGLPAPGRGGGIGYTKHVRARGHHGTFLLAFGDYAGWSESNQELSDYIRGIWSITPRIWIPRGGGAMDKEAPHDPLPGDLSIYPKGTDFCELIHRPVNDLFYFIPGQEMPHGAGLSPGETSGYNNDVQPGFPSYKFADGQIISIKRG